MPRTFVRSFAVSAFILSLAGSYSPAFPQATGTLSGTVVGDDKATLPAVITVNRIGAAPASSRAESGRDGQFILRNLPPGHYMVCVRAKGGGYLDPCTWSAISPTIQVAAGQNITGYNAIVKKGVPVQVRLNDPGHLLEAAAAPGKSAPSILVGLVTPKHFFEVLDVTAKDSAGRTHQGTMPADRASSLSITGTGVKILDQAGAALAANGPAAALTPGNGNQPVVVTFNIVKP